MSKTPWWFPWAVGALVVFQPTLVIWGVHSVVNALHEISVQLAPDGGAK